MAADPAIISVAPCGYGVAKITDEMRRLDADATWQVLRAVRCRLIVVAHGDAVFYRPGPRLVESAEILAEILYPGITADKHLGVGVVRYTPQ